MLEIDIKIPSWSISSAFSGNGVNGDDGHSIMVFVPGRQRSPSFVTVPCPVCRLDLGYEDCAYYATSRTAASWISLSKCSHLLVSGQLDESIHRGWWPRNIVASATHITWTTWLSSNRKMSSSFLGQGVRAIDECANGQLENRISLCISLASNCKFQILVSIVQGQYMMPNLNS